ncbi:MAG TPA: amidase [Vicinamibacterales bacterium]|jgi:aspartyl-tRNA(Asn)/glutamyl-tRNA(Gln) amidotransferase subunit A
MKASSEPGTSSLQRLTDVSESIRLRRLSPVDVVMTCLERIERLQPHLNAFITVAADAALDAAKTAEREIQQGRWRGPVHGIPVGIKDFYDTAGVRTTAAFERFKERTPRRDAVSVERLKRAGAIMIGKTNMHTLGMGTTGLDSCFGPVRNPWNADYIPGGSSSGSAAAVASGMCFATLDTDAIGSCRLPAACCGVVGFKGSYDAIDVNGILEGEQPPDDTIRWLSHAGLTTRSVQDAAMVFDVLAKRDDPASALHADLSSESRFRIGIADNVKVDEDVARVFDNAVAAIRELGHFMRPVPAPLIDLRRGIANIGADRESIGRLAFGAIDMLVLPTTTTTTPTVRDAARNPQALSPELTMFANYYGLPTVSVPCGVDRQGMPLGLQVVGRPHDDLAVLALASQFSSTESGTRDHT